MKNNNRTRWMGNRKSIWWLNSGTGSDPTHHDIDDRGYVFTIDSYGYGVLVYMQFANLDMIHVINYQNGYSLGVLRT
jgi:hypothetical protein